MTYNIRTFAAAPFDGKYQTSYLMPIVMFALSLTAMTYPQIEKNAKTSTLKMKVKVNEYKTDLRHSNGNVRIHIDFFIISATS